MRSARADDGRAAGSVSTSGALAPAAAGVAASASPNDVPVATYAAGTFDGKTVVGWYQGRPSSSDSSHLWHFHGGWWNESANDAAGYDLFYQIFTGTGDDDVTPTEHNYLLSTAQRVQHGLLDGSATMNDTPGYGADRPVWIVGAINSLQEAVARLEARPADGAPSQEQVNAAVKAALLDPEVQAALVQTSFLGAQQAENQ